MVRAPSAELISWDREHIARSMYPVGQSRGIVMDHRGKGVRFYDIDGKEYIDGASQLLCVNLGWGRQEISDAVKQQVEKLPYATMFFGFSNSAVVECARQLAELTPEGLDRFIFTSGGSEGNWGAGARCRWLYRPTPGILAHRKENMRPIGRVINSR